MKINLPDPAIHIKKTTFLQRIQDYVRTGHTRYVMGQIPLAKVRFFCGKFDRLYECFLGKLEASRARAAGLYSARMLLWWHDESETVTWILMVLPHEVRKDGDGVEREARHWLLPDAENQKWRDATTDRINITGFELVRLTKQVTAMEKAKLALLKRRVNETDGEEKKKDRKIFASCERCENSIFWIHVAIFP